MPVIPRTAKDLITTLQDTGYTLGDIARWARVQKRTLRRILDGTKPLRRTEMKLLAMYLGSLKKNSPPLQIEESRAVYLPRAQPIHYLRITPASLGAFFIN